MGGGAGQEGNMMKRVFEKNERRHKGKNGMSCYFIKSKCGENIHRDYSKFSIWKEPEEDWLINPAFS